MLEKFGQYCEPQKNIPFERYRFNRRCQDAGESYEQYRTALRKVAENCDFRTITPDDSLVLRPSRAPARKEGLVLTLVMLSQHAYGMQRDTAVAHLSSARCTAHTSKKEELLL